MLVKPTDILYEMWGTKIFFQRLGALGALELLNKHERRPFTGISTIPICPIIRFMMMRIPLGLRGVNPSRIYWVTARRPHTFSNSSKPSGHNGNESERRTTSHERVDRGCTRAHFVACGHTHHLIARTGCDARAQGSDTSARF